MALHVFEERYQRLLEDIGSVGGRFGIVLIERGNEVGGGDQRFDVGTVVEVVNDIALGDSGHRMVAVRGLQRFRVQDWLPDDIYPVAEVSFFGDHDAIDEGVLATTESAVRAVRNLASEVNLDDACHQPLADLATSPGTKAWQLCSLAPMATLDQLSVLKLPTMDDRLKVVAEICCERYGDLQRQLQGDARDY